MSMPSIPIPLILSSNPANGATQITKNGSRFTVVFSRPLLVPKEAISCWITCENATVIFNTPNIILDTNDTIRVMFDDGIIMATYDITIPAGLYDLDHLNATLSQQLSNAGALSDAVVLLPDTATSKVVIKYRQFYQIDWTFGNNFRELLGFDSRIAPVGGFAATDNFYEPGDNIARLNTILYYLIHSDLVSGHGLRVNGNFEDTLLQVPIDVSAGSQISYEPQNLQSLPAPNLIGQSLRELHVWLTDDQNNFVDTLGEFWSIRLNIHYLMPGHATSY